MSTHKKYDALVYIGRFQPVHNAHVEILRRAASLAHMVIIVVGSARQPSTYKNPWTSWERADMLRNILPEIQDETGAEFVIKHNHDTMYNDQAWAVRVQALVSNHTQPNDRVGIIGHDKDESTFYLKMFPQWGRESVPLIEPLNATDIRDLYFRENVNMRFIAGVVPPTVLGFLDAYRQQSQYQQIIRERVFIDTYRLQFSGLPYAPVFVTTDAVVIQSGHVLMIRRRSEPGRGLWALPGGFLNAESDPSVRDAMLRELREETGIRVPVPVLAGSVVDARVFDAVARSARGRTITHAFKIVLPDGDLPRVRGADDADRARWVPMAEINSEECFEDHYEIIQWALGG
jgi:bifunctional NMN adenylyltransferase/nudix hydrolase